MARVYFATNRVYTALPDELFSAEPAAGNPPPIWIGHGEVSLEYEDLGDERYELKGGLHVEGPLTVQPGTPLFNAITPALGAELAATTPVVRNVILFIHGFACPFSTAFHRIAELRDNYLPKTKAGAANEPLLFLFSWPSDGFLMPAAKYYASDRVDAFKSGQALASALHSLVKALPDAAGGVPPHLKLHLVAHSMGNYALRAALQKLPAGLPALFENVFLMAADEDHDALEPGMGLHPVCALAKNVFVYHSTRDLALKISETKMNNPPRLGWEGPKTFSKVPKNVTLVDCTAVSDTVSVDHGWHQYYRQRQEVYEDVAAVIAGKSADSIPHRTSKGARRYKIKRRFNVYNAADNVNTG